MLRLFDVRQWKYLITKKSGYDFRCFFVHSSKEEERKQFHQESVKNVPEIHPPPDLRFSQDIFMKKKHYPQFIVGKLERKIWRNPRNLRIFMIIYTRDRSRSISEEGLDGLLGTKTTFRIKYIKAKMIEFLYMKRLVF